MRYVPDMYLVTSVVCRPCNWSGDSNAYCVSHVCGQEFQTRRVPDMYLFRVLNALCARHVFIPSFKCVVCQNMYIVQNFKCVVCRLCIWSQVSMLVCQVCRFNVLNVMFKVRSFKCIMVYARKHSAEM